MEISDAEWEVMRVIWAQGTATSPTIIGVLSQKMNWKASTIKTLITRLVQKEMLVADRSGHKFIYTSQVSENQAVQYKMEQLIDQVCQKKIGSSIEKLLEKVTLSQTDIQSLQNALTKKMDDAPTEVSCNCVKGQCTCHLEQNLKQIGGK